MVAAGSHGPGYAYLQSIKTLIVITISIHTIASC